MFDMVAQSESSRLIQSSIGSLSEQTTLHSTLGQYQIIVTEKNQHSLTLIRCTFIAF